MNRTGISLKCLLRSSLFLPLGILAVMIIINWIMQPNLFAVRVIKSNILTFSPLIFVAMGQAVIMIGGNLDLSVGYGLSLLNCFLAMNMSTGAEAGGHNAVIIAAGLVIAIALGAVNGFIVGYTGVPSFIATFATSFIWWGAAIMICPVPGGAIPRAMTKFFKAGFGPVNMMLISILIMLAAWFVIKKRRIGRYIYAVGSSSDAAYANGIAVRKVKIISFIIGWIFVYIGTLALSAQTRAGDAAVGDPYALNSIAASVVGGVAMTGGSGSPIGAVIGAVILSMIMNIIYFSGLSTSLQILVRGIIIIVALGATVIFKRKYNG